ncbi:glycophorin-A isoform X3 [Lemur catta]|uniref:glycophorin-A isoform X3 n=1 Tax=Lemur catta TaxID=9447 RepID=UPI001E268E0D|nr:glycophorin-A isoform X3 [Lemur catta]
MTASERWAWKITTCRLRPGKDTFIRPWRFSSTDFERQLVISKMYEKIIIALLLSGFISTTTATLSTPTQEAYNSVSDGISSEQRKQIDHLFSEPVIIGIILSVIAVIDGTILLISYCICRLRKRNPSAAQPSPTHDTGVPLSSVETENPERSDE